jgi:hypothetical protein
VAEAPQLRLDNSRTVASHLELGHTESVFGYIIPSFCLGTLLIAFSIYVAVRVFRAPDPQTFQPIGSPIAMRAMGLFFIVIIIVLAVQFLRA